MNCNKIILKFIRKRKFARIAKRKVDETEQWGSHALAYISFIRMLICLNAHALLGSFRKRMDLCITCNTYCHLSSFPKIFVWSYLMSILWHIHFWAVFHWQGATIDLGSEQKKQKKKRMKSSRPPLWTRNMSHSQSELKNSSRKPLCEFFTNHYLHWHPERSSWSWLEWPVLSPPPMMVNVICFITVKKLR